MPAATYEVRMRGPLPQDDLGDLEELDGATLQETGSETVLLTLDIDQHTLAWENTFWDRTGSLEIRVPIDVRSWLFARKIVRLTLFFDSCLDIGFHAF